MEWWWSRFSCQRLSVLGLGRCSLYYLPGKVVEDFFRILEAFAAQLYYLTPVQSTVFAVRYYHLLLLICPQLPALRELDGKKW